jgi:L,D-transpeptidase ErfK/SrfK
MLVLLGVVALPARAEIYAFPEGTDSVIGSIQVARAGSEDTLLHVARRHSIGFREIKALNPALDIWIPGQDIEVTLPTEYILPQAAREGIVLNIPEMRLYYYPRAARNAERQVITYPIGIGREGFMTPYVKTSIRQKAKDPIWYPPESIRAEHAAEGDPLPKVVPPGPDNPMGGYALRLNLPMYAIHGTNKPFGVGMRVSHGCIRLYPEDIEELFGMVPVGTPVQIVNQPYKVGLRGGDIYLEAHPALEEDNEQFQGNMTSVVKSLVAITGERAYHVDWELAKQEIERATGVPIRVGMLLAPVVEPAVAGREPASRADASANLGLRLDTRVPAAATD